MAPLESIDQYLAGVSAAQRAALEKLRRTIRAAAPRAEECISYQLPAFRRDGVLVGFGATAKHCAFYLMSATTVAAHVEDLAGYDTSKGTVRFAPDEPLPATLVKKLVKARLAENAARKTGSSSKGSTVKSARVAKPAKTEETAKTANGATTARPALLAKAAKSATATTAGSASKRGAIAKSAVTTKSAAARGSGADVKSVLASIEALGTQRDRDNLGRFGIVAPKSFGVSMANLRVLEKRYGRDHELAAALWESGWYEARLLATLVDEPARVTPAQMESWCRDFDNWAICDTACFALFDRTPHAWDQIAAWRRKPGEFQKRAAFALLASLALHDKKGGDEPFVAGLGYVEEAADDERNFVKKGVNWALRAVGRRSPRLNALAVPIARRLAASSDATARWIGKDALREFEKVAARRAAGSKR